MRFFVKAVTVMGALSVTGSILLGILIMPPAASAALSSLEVPHIASLASETRIFPKAPQDEHLSDEERAALNKPEHERNEREKQLAKSAKEKIKTNEKYHGDRNKKKRQNTKRKAPKGAKTIRPPASGWGGGGGRF